ncbi:trna methyl transferase, putative [Theileria annulata]|uniref:tRNA-5-taurinomethyluridine 2-sulfurtransferase n=1 Tax=Theileria annulata TaxID=5874 RepID=Q4UE41_THEAN|nr:trna methyl transferase, putative [Theileria annulata]CAI74648.1 trna methyl transferase, putative [Theileria annulata]|eukprot:XP_952380.1 trna methyl transferase, putative [Theileria annulata]
MFKNVVLLYNYLFFIFLNHFNIIFVIHCNFAYSISYNNKFINNIEILNKRNNISKNNNLLYPYLFIYNRIYNKCCKNEPFRANSDTKHTLTSTLQHNYNDLNEKIKHRIESESSCLLEDNLNKSDFVQELARLGRSIYSNIPTPTLFKSVPNGINLLKSFNSNDFNSLGCNGRDYFLVKSPVPVDYKLLDDCSSSIYISIHLDKDKKIYLDGISDSFVFKGIISLLISLIGWKNSTEVEVDNVKKHKFFKKVIDHGIISENSLNSILNHIKNELKKQDNPTKGPKRTSMFQSPRSKKRVAVLVSGGVDSSLALWIMKSRGFDVQAFHLKVNDLSNGPGLCSSNDISYAMEVCNILRVTLHVLPFSQVYDKHILSDVLDDYRKGEVPNPDILCNSRIKFGEFLKMATDWGFDYVATGHYATLCDDFFTKEQIKSPSYLDGCTSINGYYRIKRLCLSTDTVKDQTYFLSRLNQNQMSRLIFPIGNILKTQVRDFAKTVGLPTYNKKDSFGLCFLEDLDLSEYLTKTLGESRGPIVEYETNKVIGEHNGLYNFTIGQKKTINNYLNPKHVGNTPKYVVKKDIYKNTLYVSASYNEDFFTNPRGIRSSFKVRDFFWNTPDYKDLINKVQSEVSDNFKFKVKLRHTPNYNYCNINFKGDEATDLQKWLPTTYELAAATIASVDNSKCSIKMIQLILTFCTIEDVGFIHTADSKATTIALFFIFGSNKDEKDGTSIELEDIVHEPAPSEHGSKKSPSELHIYEIGKPIDYLDWKQHKRTNSSQSGRNGTHGKTHTEKRRNSDPTKRSKVHKPQRITSELEQKTKPNSPQQTTTKQQTNTKEQNTNKQQSSVEQKTKADQSGPITRPFISPSVLKPSEKAERVFSSNEKPAVQQRLFKPRENKYQKRTERYDTDMDFEKIFNPVHENAKDDEPGSYMPFESIYDLSLDKCRLNKAFPPKGKPAGHKFECIDLDVIRVSKDFKNISLVNANVIHPKSNTHKICKISFDNKVLVDKVDDSMEFTAVVLEHVRSISILSVISTNPNMERSAIQFVITGKDKINVMNDYVSVMSTILKSEL